MQIDILPAIDTDTVRELNRRELVQYTEEVVRRAVAMLQKKSVKENSLELNRHTMQSCSHKE